MREEFVAYVNASGAVGRLFDRMLQDVFKPDLEVFNCEQGTAEWFACRLGIPTASEFSTVMAKGKGGAPSKTREEYMLRLIGERMTGQLADNFTNKHTERGKELEPEARLIYAMDSPEPVAQVGFIRRGRAGASPDSLVGESGMLEIKTKLPKLQLKTLLAKKVPAEHIDQMQGQLWIAGREWNDFLSYWPGMPVIPVRIHRDEEHIKLIESEVNQFLTDMDEKIEQIKKDFGAEWFNTRPRFNDPLQDFEEVEDVG